MKEYYIDKIERVSNKLLFTLDENFPPYFDIEKDKLSKVIIEITNPDNNESIENLHNFIDPWKDGIMFEITELKEFRTTDLGSRNFTIRGSNINSIEVPYSDSQLLDVIEYLRETNRKTEETVNMLNKKIDIIKKYAMKEINSAERIIESLKSRENKHLKWKFKLDFWKKVIYMISG